MGKVLVAVGGLELVISSDDILGTIQRFKLNGQLVDERRKMAALGLMYLLQLAKSNDGADKPASVGNYGCNMPQDRLLSPACEFIDLYLNPPQVKEPEFFCGVGGEYPMGSWVFK